jgi:hypothetical protein
MRLSVSVWQEARHTSRQQKNIFMGIGFQS